MGATKRRIQEVLEPASDGDRASRVFDVFIIVILGIGMFALPAGILAGGFTEQISRRSDKAGGTGAQDDEHYNVCEKADARPSRDCEGPLDAAGTGPLPYGRGAETSFHARF